MATNAAVRAVTGLDTLSASQVLGRLCKVHCLLEKGGGGPSTYYRFISSYTGPNEGDLFAEHNNSLAEACIPYTNKGNLATNGGDLAANGGDLPPNLLTTIAQLTPKAKKEILWPVILRLCDIKPHSAEELAQILGRKVKRLKDNHLSAMREQNLIDYLHPNVINHPQQAYIITRQGKHWLATKGSSLLTDIEQHSGNQPLPAEPLAMTELASSLSLAFMLMLERLSPKERVVYVLKQGFDFSFREIAEQIDLSEVNCRQLFNRARNHIQANDRRFTARREQHLNLLRLFQQALESGEIAPLAELLAEDVVLYSDGGGKALAALRPIYGCSKVSRLMAGLARKWAPFKPQFLLREVNGAPGAVWLHLGRVESVVAVDFLGDKGQNIYIMRNPEKIGYIQARVQFGGRVVSSTGGN